MKIIIYGANEVGSLIAAEFYEDHDITVIDPDPKALEGFSRLDIAYMQGDGGSVSVLKEAGIGDCDVFIACTNTDEANIVACIMAKHLLVPKVACFVSRKESLESLKEVKNDVSCESLLHFDAIVWPEKLLQREIFRIITVPDAIDVEDFLYCKARLLEYRIKEDFALLKKPLKDCDFPEDVLVVGIVRDEELFIPHGEAEFKLNDKAIFMGTPDGLNLIVEKFFARGALRNVTIIGGGSVGYELGKSFERAHIKTKIIENNYERSKFLSENIKHSLILHADGTNLDLLRQENIEESSVVICVTDNDEKNLLCSLLLKQLCAKRVIARVSRPEAASLFEKVGVDIAISPKEAAIHEIRKTLIEPHEGILATVERGLGEIVQINVPKNYTARKLLELRLPKKALVAIIQRNNKVIIPKGQTLIMAQDSLIVFTMSENVQAIKDYFVK